MTRSTKKQQIAKQSVSYSSREKHNRNAVCLLSYNDEKKSFVFLYLLFLFCARPKQIEYQTVGETHARRHRYNVMYALQFDRESINNQKHKPTIAKTCYMQHEQCEAQCYTKTGPACFRTEHVTPPFWPTGSTVVPNKTQSRPTALTRTTHVHDKSSPHVSASATLHEQVPGRSTVVQNKNEMCNTTLCSF